MGKTWGFTISCEFDGARLPLSVARGYRSNGDAYAAAKNMAARFTERANVKIVLWSEGE